MKYKGTAPTEGMSDKERKKFIRNLIIEKFDENGIWATIQLDRITAKNAKIDSVGISLVWFDMLEEFITDKQAIDTINYYFGKNSPDTCEHIRWTIYDEVRKYCNSAYLKSSQAKQKFNELVANSYVIAFDSCSRLMAENGIWRLETLKHKE